MARRTGQTDVVPTSIVVNSTTANTGSSAVFARADHAHGTTLGGLVSLSAEQYWTAGQTLSPAAASTGFPTTTVNASIATYGKTVLQYPVSGMPHKNASVPNGNITADNLIVSAASYMYGPGTLSLVSSSASLTSGVQYITVDASGRFLYAASGSGSTWTVYCYAINQITGVLTQVGTFSSVSYVNDIACDPHGRSLYTAIYGSVNATSINLATGGFYANLGDTAAYQSGTNVPTMSVDPLGRYVFTQLYTNTTSYIVANRINSDGSATFVNVTQINATNDASGSHCIDPWGKFLYVASYVPTIVHAYSLSSGGSGTLVASYAQGTNNYPYRIIAEATGRFLYVSRPAAGTIMVYKINESTGALTAGTAVSTSATGFYGRIATDRQGRYVAITNSASSVNAGKVQLFAIDQITGQLTSIQTYDLGTGTTPNALAFHPSGKFLFVGNSAANQGVQTFTIASMGTNNLAIGNVSSQAYTLQLAADSAGKPTSSSWTIVSDARVKEVTGSYQRGLADVVALTPKKYRLNGKHGSVDDGKEHVSIIAQEAQDIWPEMIGAFPCQETDPETGETIQLELLNLNTNDLQWGLVNAIKELAEQNAAMQARIDALEAKP